jgi:hypothetical protein
MLELQKNYNWQDNTTIVNGAGEADMIKIV